MSPLVPVLLGYALGSIPFSFLIARLSGIGDVRNVGSGNVGATNVMRAAGKGPGLAALLLDGSKGAAAVLLSRPLASSEAEVCLAGLCAVIGHLFPVWLGFRGGKGVATGAGLFLPLAPSALAAAAGVFLATLATFRYVSLASILASVSLPVALYLFDASLTVTLTGLAVALLVVAKHRANLGRLLRRVEPRIGRKG